MGTYASTGDTATTAASAATATATTTSALATLVAAGALTATNGTLLGLRGLGLAGELNRHLARQDLLAREALNGCSGFGSGGEVDESVANGTVGAGVHRDRGALARDLR
jgi:hypothetical protein